jgi:N-acetylglucosaminyldiphosphoundecaprenol N-acetyl-beta-D-mannosaminyltransferase
MNEIRRITVLDCPIDSATMEQTVSRCVGWQHDPHRRPRTLITVNAAIVVTMRQDEPLRRAVEAGDLIVPDGMPVVWASRLLGKPLVERVAGVDLMARLLEVASQHQWRVFLLGAREEVLQTLMKICREKHPGLVIAGHRNGYFKEHDHPEVIQEVRESRSDLLFVGMPTPFKEIWCERHREALGVPIIMGVGGSFDVLAGYIRRAPKWMQACALEWSWRLMMEPRKMWKRYLVTNTKFLWLLFRRRLGLLKPRHQGVEAPRHQGEHDPASASIR